MRSFASDNNASVHPDVLAALARVNEGHVVAYGDDAHTQRATHALKQAFGGKAEVFFVFNGTAANVLSLESLARPHQAIICAKTAHIQNDECGAPERFTGCKLLPVITPNGKLTPELIASEIRGLGDQHHVQPRAVSITQTSEMGTLYSLAELRAISEFVHSQGLLLHVDGARFSNAAAALGVSLAELARGIDVLSFGGTKNGLISGEAVIFLDPTLAEGFKFRRKQAMQLSSKMRYVSAQFEAYLAGDLWLRNAKHANSMAQLLANSVNTVPGIKITQAVQANAVFARVPTSVIQQLLKKYFFYIWDDRVIDGCQEVRWMCSFDTQLEDIQSFTDSLRELASE